MEGGLVFAYRRSIGETLESIYQDWIPLYGLEPLHGIDFELYDERFIGPEEENTAIDLYIPVKC